MTQEREDYMRRQDAEHHEIGMRQSGWMQAAQRHGLAKSSPLAAACSAAERASLGMAAFIASKDDARDERVWGEFEDARESAEALIRSEVFRLTGVSADRIVKALS